MPRQRGIRAAWLVLIAALLNAATPFAHATRGSLLEQLPQHWQDDQGRDTRLSKFLGRPVVITMAYATCHRVCPTTMARLEDIQHAFDARGQSATFVVIGYDPANDDPQAWRQYRETRGLLRDNWHFLTGTPASVEQAARLLGFDFWKYDQHVMHEQRLVLLDARGALASAGEMAAIAPLLTPQESHQLAVSQAQPADH